MKVWECCLLGAPHVSPLGFVLRCAVYLDIDLPTACVWLFIAAGHTGPRSSSQPQHGVARALPGINAEDSSPPGVDNKLRNTEGSDGKSVHFAMTESLSGRKHDSAKRDREQDAAARPPVQEKDVTEQTGAASTPGMPVQKASGSKLQAKKTRSRPSFVEGF